MPLNMRVKMKKQGTGKRDYFLSSSTASVNEGQQLTFTILGHNIPTGTEIFYTITGISQSDLSVGLLNGSVTMVNNVANVTITIAQDQITEGNETLTFTMTGIGITSAQEIVRSITVDVIDTSTEPTYFLSRSVASVNEGSSVTITVTTTNVFDGTSLPYTVTGISQNDLSSGSLTGNVTINNNTGSVVFDIAADALTEGAETMTFTLDGIGTSINVLINDTSDDSDVRGSAVYTTPGTYTFTVPPNVTSVSVVAVGGATTDSYFQSSSVVKGGFGGFGNNLASGGGFAGAGGGAGGGTGSFINVGGYVSGNGGGGAGGYSGNGGKGGSGVSSQGHTRHCRGGAGGGVGIYGEGISGQGVAFATGTKGGNGTGGAGGGGSGGDNNVIGSYGLIGTGGSGGLPTTHYNSMDGGQFGGGAGGLSSGAGAGAGLGWKNNISVTPGQTITVQVGNTSKVTNSGYTSSGAVRIVWGPGRSFPSTDVDSTDGEVIVN